MKNEIERLLFSTKGVVNFNPESYIEVQPGIMSPLIVNIKATLGVFPVRRRLVKAIAERVSLKSICICGIESGGSYYASAVADVLRKPLVLFRKKEKGYGFGGRFVGTVPPKGGLVTMVDDVLAGGMISTATNKALTENGYRSELVVIYSYLPKLTGPLSKVRIAELANIEGLCETGLAKGDFTKDDVGIIRRECVWSNE